jgi:acyl-CoA reductase-like NAD-dependent aldehyde dehydrogenase/ABC-type branched-subunit amino acid transport system ATPase component
MLEVARVSAAYGKHTALSGVDLVVGEQEIVVILGANGAGKSTLLKVIAGVVPNLAGSAISLGGRALTDLAAHEIVEAGVALVPEGRGVFAELTVAENLMLGAHPRRARADEKKNHDAVLTLFPRLRERMGQAVRTMSGGEQQMVAIGRALMSAPEVLLLDEPSLGLSPLLAHELFDALVRIRAAGVSVLLVEQNARESLRIADRGYLLETGRIVGEGRADRLAADPAVREAYLGVAGHATLVPSDAIEIEALAGPLEADVIEVSNTLAVTPAQAGVHREPRSLVRAPVAPAVMNSGFRRNDGDEEDSSTTTIPTAPSPRGRVSEDRSMFHTRLIIADRDVGAGDSRTFDRLDPVTGEVATRAAAASIGDAQKAADAAAAAFPEWSRTAPGERRKLLLKAADILQSKVDDFAAAVIAETGSPGHWAHFNVGLAADMIREAASMTTQVTGEVIPSNRPGSLAMATRQPAGVILSIAPWNAPIILGVRSVAMPLACGNTVVFKASENCPRTHALIVECFREAGLPKGAINLVTNAPADAAKIVEALIAHPKVKRINFTGSTRVGRIIAETAARYLKPVLLELGGKAPLIVLDDADVDEAVNAAVFGSFANAGQICMSTEKIVLDNAVADAFLAKFAARAAGLPAGDPRGHVVLGACISADAVRRVADLIKDATGKGAVVLAGGPADGPVMQATVVDRVTPAMRLFDEESFGPVVSVIRVDGEEEAIRVANDTEYGLSAAVFTRDIARGLRVAQRIESGICHINGPTVHDEAQMPFGGTKASGYGRFGGKAAINEFTELRWITIQTEPMHYPF